MNNGQELSVDTFCGAHIQQKAPFTFCSCPNPLTLDSKEGGYAEGLDINNVAECVSATKLKEEDVERESASANVSEKEDVDDEESSLFDLDGMDEAVLSIEEKLALSPSTVLTEDGHSYFSSKWVSSSVSSSSSALALNDDDPFFKASSLDFELNLPQRSCPPTDSMCRSNSVRSSCRHHQQWAMGQSVASSPRFNDSAYSRSGSTTPFTQCSPHHHPLSVSPSVSGLSLNRHQMNWGMTSLDGPIEIEIERNLQNSSPSPPDFASLGMAEVLGMGLTLREILDFGLLCRMTADQNGSKYIERILWSLGTEERVNAVEDIMRCLMSIQVDWAEIAECRSGHHVVGRLFECGSKAQRQLLLDHFVKRSVLRLSCSEFGCRFVQNILAMMDEAEREGLVRSLREQCSSKEVMGNVLCSGYASFVLQSVIALELPFESVAFIGSALEEDLAYFSRNQYSCRIVQAMVHCYGDQLDVMRLCTNGQHVDLVATKYGNYVIQCILQRAHCKLNNRGLHEFKNRLIADLFKPHSLRTLSVEKAGSHVIESCIRVANWKQLDCFVDAVKRDGAKLLSTMLFHRFANFVVRTLMHSLCETQRNALVHVIHQRVVDLLSDHNHNEMGRGRRFSHCPSRDLLEQCRAIKIRMDLAVDQKRRCGSRYGYGHRQSGRT